MNIFFRSEKLWQQHYEKHGMEMGFDNKEDYLLAANRVIENENVLHKLEEEDGDDVYYLEVFLYILFFSSIFPLILFYLHIDIIIIYWLHSLFL